MRIDFWRGGVALALGFTMTLQSLAAPAAPPTPPRRPPSLKAPDHPIPPERPRAAAKPEAPAAQKEEADQVASESATSETADDKSCAMLFKENQVIAAPAPDVDSPVNGCGLEDAVVMRGVRMPDGSEVTFKGAVTVRCALAREVAAWLREDVAPALHAHGATLDSLVGLGGYACRRRNRQATGRISEHAIGNALDIRTLGARGGETFAIMNQDESTKSLRESIRASACKRFTTVLGAGSDGFHEDHLHVDLRTRRNGFRLCQWDIR